MYFTKNIFLTYYIYLIKYGKRTVNEEYLIVNRRNKEENIKIDNSGYKNIKIQNQTLNFSDDYLHFKNPNNYNSIIMSQKKNIFNNKLSFYSLFLFGLCNIKPLLSYSDTNFFKELNFERIFCKNEKKSKGEYYQLKECIENNKDLIKSFSSYDIVYHLIIRLITVNIVIKK